MPAPPVLLFTAEQQTAGPTTYTAVADVTATPAITIDSGLLDASAAASTSLDPALAATALLEAAATTSITFAPAITADATVTSGATEWQATADIPYAPALTASPLLESQAAADISLAPAVTTDGLRETTATTASLTLDPATAVAATLEGFAAATVPMAPAVSADATIAGGAVEYQAAASLQVDIQTGAATPAVTGFAAAGLTLDTVLAADATRELAAQAALTSAFTVTADASPPGVVVAAAVSATDAARATQTVTSIIRRPTAGDAPTAAASATDRRLVTVTAADT